MEKRRTGLLVIRAWIEKGSTNPLRAEVSQTSDVSAGFTSKASLADVDRVLAEVKVFLNGLAAN